MKRSARYTLLVVLAGFVVLSGDALFGATLKPGGINSATISGPGLNANHKIRDLRAASGASSDDGFVRTWYIFSDLNNAVGAVDGILDPGDTRIGEFKNWWTPVSAATQHGYEIGAPPIPPGDTEYPSTPIDHQPKFTTNPLQGLPQKAGTIGFYLTYSHMDNANFDTEFLDDGTGQAVFNQRNRERNGYAMGWLTGETVVDALGVVEYGTGQGNVKMDIFIHNGKSDNNAAGTGLDDNHNFGTNQTAKSVWYGGVETVKPGDPYSTVSQSEPQVAQSNEMDTLARQDDNLMLVPDYRDDFVINNPASQTGFTYGPNDQGYVFAGFNEDKYRVDHDGIGGPISPTIPVTVVNQNQFVDVVASMDVREVNSYAYGVHPELGGVAAIHPGLTPQALLTAGVTDGIVVPGGQSDYYFYEDSFVSRDGRLVAPDPTKGSLWTEGSTDGGVIAGLSGYDEYSQYYPRGANPDPAKLGTHWGEQQVIRLDFDKTTFDKDGLVGIKEIIFYDWGDPSAVSGQQFPPPTVPTAIVISVDNFQNLYFDKDGIPGLTNVGLPGGDIPFPDNRIYIAQVEHTPEPATMILLAAGASALLARRRRRRK